MNTLGTIFTVIGAVLFFGAAGIAWSKGMNDDDLDKFDMYWGRYLVQYPVYLILLLVGAALLGLGWLMAW